MSNATITMSINEFDEMRERLRLAHITNGELTAKLNAALQADPEVSALVDALMAALPIIRFGVSNLDPRAVTRWPYRELSIFADALQAAPGLGPDMQECAIELRAFAGEAKIIEQNRDDRGIYDGPDPIDMILLGQITRGEFTRVGRLVSAGYLAELALTDEGREAITSARAIPQESPVAAATDSA